MQPTSIQYRFRPVCVAAPASVAEVKCVKAKKQVKRKLDHGGGSFV